MTTKARRSSIRKNASWRLLSQYNSVPPPIIDDSAFFVALYEFTQGGEPKTVWCEESTTIKDSAQFRLYVVNTPVFNSQHSLTPVPASVQSEYDGIFYLAYYFQVSDVEARGFNRAAVFVVAHRIKSIMISIHRCRSAELKAIVEHLQNASFKTFTQEIVGYAASLKKLMESTDPPNQGLSSKMEGLQPILDSLGIKDLPVNSAKDRKPEYFTIINNNLRDIRQLTGFHIAATKIFGLIKDFPAAPAWGGMLLHILPHGNLGGFQEPTLSLFYHRNLTFPSHDLILDCLHTLMSGGQIMVTGDDDAYTERFSKCLSYLCPIGFSYTLSLAGSDGYDGYSDPSAQILVGTSLSPEMSPMLISKIDLASGVFTGHPCPPESILKHEITSDTDYGYNAYYHCFMNEIKNIGQKFTCKLYEFINRKNITASRLLEGFAQIGFGEDDLTIVRHLASLTEFPIKLDEEFWFKHEVASLE